MLAEHDVEREESERRAEEQRLVERARAGDHDAFAAIYRRYYDRLCRVAMRYLRSRDAATETVQELFLQLWQRRSELTVRGDLGAFLYAATRNRALDALRRTRRESGQDDAQDRREPATEALIDERFLALELEAALQRAIDELPRRPREILRLRLERGLSYREIASELGIAVKTVEMHLTRAVALLRVRLRDDGPGKPNP